MKTRCGEVVFWHLVFVSAWISLFLVPLDWWPSRIPFHFFFSLAVILHQFIWGAIIMPWTKKYHMVCVLTIIMQALRGFKISDAGNFEHSFIEELFARAKVRIPTTIPTILTLSIVAATAILYFFSR